jgi:hypothetical protein
VHLRLPIVVAEMPVECIRANPSREPELDSAPPEHKIFP